MDFWNKTRQFLGGRAEAAKAWAAQNSPGYQAVTQRSVRPLVKGAEKAIYRQMDTPMAPVGRIKYFTPEEIAEGSMQFAKTMRHYRPITGAERMMDIEAARSRAINKLARLNRIRQPLTGSPEAKFRALIDLYKN